MYNMPHPAHCFIYHNIKKRPVRKPCVTCQLFGITGIFSRNPAILAGFALVAFEILIFMGFLRVLSENWQKSYK